VGISRERPQKTIRYYQKIQNDVQTRGDSDYLSELVIHAPCVAASSARGSGGGGVRFAGFVYDLYTKNHYLPPYTTVYLCVTRHGVIIWGVGGVIHRH
jgi:hypothetical protein